MTRFSVHRASGDPIEPYIDFASLEEFLNWTKEQGCQIIIHHPEYNEYPELMLYDDYIE